MVEASGDSERGRGFACGQHLGGDKGAACGKGVGVVDAGIWGVVSGCEAVDADVSGCEPGADCADGCDVLGEVEAVELVGFGGTGWDDADEVRGEEADGFHEAVGVLEADWFEGVMLAENVARHVVVVDEDR